VTPTQLRTLLIFAALGVVLASGRKLGEPYRSLLAYSCLAVLAWTRVLPLWGAALVAATGGGMHLAVYLGRKRAEGSIRDYVLQLGVRVDEVERELPFTDRSSRHVTLRKGRSTRYTIPRLGAAAPAEWAFLMRTKKDGAQFPHGFLFRSAAGEAPAAMAEIFTRIARSSDQDYLEFEASPSEVSAYWDAWGGKKQFDRIHGFLQGLAAF
jgi:hypothetical protein